MTLIPPVEPPPTPWALPDPAQAADDQEMLAVGADLEPGTLLAAYRRGLFPMPVDDAMGQPAIGWWSPDPRGVLPLDRLHVSRSLRRSCARYEVRIDSDTASVIDGCTRPGQPGSWITPAIRAAYLRLYDLGWVHSVEAWSHDDHTLAGGLYGVAIGGLFAGESMFSHGRDASKVALVALVDLLQAAGARGRLVDVQWRTQHLASLGVVAIPRADYLRRLAAALEAPPVPQLLKGANPTAAADLGRTGSRRNQA